MQREKSFLFMDKFEDYKEDWSQFLKGPYKETQSSSCILFDGEIDWKVNLKKTKIK